MWFLHKKLDSSLEAQRVDLYKSVMWTFLVCEDPFLELSALFLGLEVVVNFLFNLYIAFLMNKFFCVHNKENKITFDFIGLYVWNLRKTSYWIYTHVK